MKKIDTLDYFSPLDVHKKHEHIQELPLDSDTQYIIYAGQHSNGIGKLLESMIDSQFKQASMKHRKNYEVICTENGQDVIDIYQKASKLKNPPLFIMVSSKYRDRYDPVKLCQQIDKLRRENNLKTNISTHSINTEFNQTALAQGLVDEKVDKSDLNNLSYKLMVNLVMDSLRGIEE